MNTTQPPAASHTPRTSAEEPTAEEHLSAHAKRTLLTRVRARIRVFLEAGIALLQRLRKKTGGAQDAEEVEDRAESRRDRPMERQESATPPDEAAAEAPKPKRRLRAFLIYVSVMLAGGIGGGALVYLQFQKQLGQQLEENLRLEAALAEKTRPSAEIRKALEEERAKRTEAQKKLEASLAEYSKSATEKQKLLDAAEKQLAALLAGEGARSVQWETPSSRRSDGSRTHLTKSGNCTLDTKNIGTLKACIEDFNQ